MNKRGMELAFGTVVTIVIVLLVLIIASVMLIRGSTSFFTGTSCEKQGGTCIGITDDTCSGSIVPLSCSGDKPKCCK